MDKLFKPFQQVDMSLPKRYGGSGLGLYLSKKLADLLGGDVRVESEYGVGSEFSLALPLKYGEGRRNDEEEDTTG
jgi:signal transduction histidine kinase